MNKKPLIEFISTTYGLDQVEDALPRPAKNFLPNWWKEMPSGNTVKNCPSFPDFFSQGYIVPMWADSVLAHDKEHDVTIKQTCPVVPQWQEHPAYQFLDHVKAKTQGVDASFVFKANCPWRVITPPGWSVMQLPLFYHFDNDFSVLPGIIDTDIHHEINQQVLYHGNGKKVEIKRGTPLALYVPFERKKIEYVVRYQNEQDHKKLMFSSMNLLTKLPGNGRYRDMQRKRDKNVR